jgi:YVTN family beta-propeller protein
VGIEPEGVAVSPDGLWVFVTSETSNSVSMIDAKTNAVVANMLVDLRPRAAAVSPDGKRVFVTAEVAGTLSVIDIKAREVTRTITLERGEGKRSESRSLPMELSCTSRNGRACTVSVVDAATLKLVATIPVGKRPWGIAISRDGRFVYTANGLSNDVSVIDRATNKVVANVNVGQRPWGVAVGW